MDLVLAVKNLDPTLLSKLLSEENDLSIVSTYNMYKYKYYCQNQQIWLRHVQDQVRIFSVILFHEVDLHLLLMIWFEVSVV
jgi:hypothetical protein